MKILGAEAACCALPLPLPFRLGTTEVRSRDYVALRVVAEDGTEGFGVGYTGGTQTFETLALLSRELIGRDAIARRHILQDLESRHVPARAAIQRALSLIDLALWDIACKLAGLPLYRYLGALRENVPSMAVAGFRHHERGTPDVLSEVGALREQSIAQVKVLIDGSLPASDADYVGQVTKCAGQDGEVVVDAHWTWRALAPALQACARLDDMGLGFIEDPFLPVQWRLAGELAGRLKTPIAAGEDVGDISTLRELCGAVGVVRIDATTGGGITGALAAMDLAAAFGRMVVPHVFPYIHVQLACSHPSVTAVEFIPEAAQVDPVRTLFQDFSSLIDGRMIPSARPGIGVHLDWQAVKAASRQFAVTHTEEL